MRTGPPVGCLALARLKPEMSRERPSLKQSPSPLPKMAAKRPLCQRISPSAAVTAVGRGKDWMAAPRSKVMSEATTSIT